jgi:hypothetical protein
METGNADTVAEATEVCLSIGRNLLFYDYLF